MRRRPCNAESLFFDNIIFIILLYCRKEYFPSVTGVRNTLRAFVYNNDLKRMFRQNQTIL